MILNQLYIHCLRNLATTRLHLHAQLNVIIGPNGSGKTSILEAIYLLGTGHSFRTREILPLIQNGQPTLSVFGRTNTDETVSVQKSLTSATQVKINQTACTSNSHLARFLPCQVFYQDIFQIMDAGPTVRRRLLDWGLFHVKQNYLDLWKNYRRVLDQRNILLRKKAAYEQFEPWDDQLVELAYALDALRTQYFTVWEVAFSEYMNRLSETSCTIEYYKGWGKRDNGKNLRDILKDQFAADTQRQHTQSGPHQADIVFKTSINKAKHELSRGQQKIILIALKLSQASMLDNPCIYLFDDLSAELDAVHIQRTLDCIQQLKGQSFVSTIQADSLGSKYHQLSKTNFVIENGTIRQEDECFT